MGSGHHPESCGAYLRCSVSWGMSRYLARKDAESAINEAEARGNLAISAASNAAEARAAYEAVTWP